MKKNWTPFTIGVSIVGVVGAIMALIGGYGLYGIGFDWLLGVEHCDYRKMQESCGTGLVYVKDDLAQALALLLAGKPTAAFAYFKVKQQIK